MNVSTDTAERERIAIEAVELARNPGRPRALQVIAEAFTEWTELRGDRLFGDDRAVVGGPALLAGATRERRPLSTFALDAEVRFASAADRAGEQFDKFGIVKDLGARGVAEEFAEGSEHFAAGVAPGGARDSGRGRNFKTNYASAEALGLAFAGIDC